MSAPSAPSAGNGTRRGAASAPERAREELGADLEALLIELTVAHEDWIAAVHAHREGVRHADPVAMRAGLAGQQACAARVAALEERRRAVVDRASRVLDLSPGASGGRTGPITLGEIAAATASPARDRLVARAAALRGLISDLRRANSTLQAASAALLGHTEGLMRQIARRLSAAGTYGRRGFVEPAPGMACAVDLFH